MASRRAVVKLLSTSSKLTRICLSKTWYAPPYMSRQRAPNPYRIPIDKSQMTAGPGDPTHAPGNSTHIPGHSTHRPGNSTYPPGNSTYPPEHPTYPPGNSTHPPGHPTYPPGNSTHPPWNSTHTPGNPPHKQESCNFSLCNGIPFKDNQHPVKTFSANAQLSFQYNITTPQPGHANLSVVDTKTNKPIGVPLKVFDKFGETTDNPDELDWSFMMSDTGKQCSTPGDCVLQFWWHSDE